MKEIIRQNRLYLTLFAIFFILTISFVLNNEHGDGVLFFAKHRNGFMNVFFEFMTKAGETAGYIFCISLVLILGYRNYDSLMFLLAGFLVLITSSLAKLFFEHPRPLPYFRSLKQVDELNLIEGIKVYIAQTSFPSGHTTSGFAIFSLLAFFTWKQPLLVILFFLVALTIGISRVYLVQHFLEDILAGATLGTMVALFVRYIHSRIKIKEEGILAKKWRK